MKIQTQSVPVFHVIHDFKAFSQVILNDVTFWYNAYIFPKEEGLWIFFMGWREYMVWSVILCALCCTMYYSTL